MESDGAVSTAPGGVKIGNAPQYTDRAIGDSQISALPVLSLSGVSKRYPGVVALDRIDLDIYGGQIHAIVGENGAGKSTLIKIITGVIDSDEGEISSSGVAVEIGTPRNASKIGMAAVLQDVLLVPELPIGRNILLGMEAALVQRASLNPKETEVVRKALKQVGASFAPDALTRDLSVPELRLAQIARALVMSGEIIVLDEPTSVLSEPDAEHLLERLVAFRDVGKAIIYITHRLGEVMQIADRVTVLRDGKRVGHFSRGEFDRARLVALMAKEERNFNDEMNPAVEQEALSKHDHTRVAEAPALTVQRMTSGRRFVEVSFSASAGEIVGLAGVQGSGHGHILRAIAGVDARDSGNVYLSGIEVAPGSPSLALRSGLLLVPADRRGAGIVPSQTIRENIMFGPRTSKNCNVLGFRQSANERKLVLDQINKMSIKAASPEILTGNLSGGNQQKVALARALTGHVRVLLMEEPTQGIDVRSREEIHSILRRIVKERKCTLVIASSEFEELIELADIIHVMRLGHLVATFSEENISYHNILHEAMP
jgi:ABC-type sugar transport system ATPase subunit